MNVREFGNGAKTKSRKNSEIVFPEFLRPLVEGLLNLPGDKLLHMNKDNFYKEYYACKGVPSPGSRKL